MAFQPNTITLTALCYERNLDSKLSVFNPKSNCKLHACLFLKSDQRRLKYFVEEARFLNYIFVRLKMKMLILVKLRNENV